MTRMPRYSRLMVALHWLTAVLIVVAWFVSESGRQVRQDPPMLHFALGLAVLVLVVPRLIARVFGGAPSPRGNASVLRLAAMVGHLAFYLLMIALPLSGWYVASRMGVQIAFFGFEVPALTEAVQGPPGPVAELHELGGTLVVILAGLHGLMALYHHFVLHDDTLRRMRPV